MRQVLRLETTKSFIQKKGSVNVFTMSCGNIGDSFHFLSFWEALCSQYNYTFFLTEFYYHGVLLASDGNYYEEEKPAISTYIATSSPQLDILVKRILLALNNRASRKTFTSLICHNMTFVIPRVIFSIF